MATSFLAIAAVSLFVEQAGGDEQQADDVLLMQGSETIGLEVFNKQGEELGEVEDLIVNVKRGAISHVLVSSGGFLGIGDRLLPVPIAVVDFGEKKGVSDMWFARIDLKREDVDKAPAIEDDVVSQLAEDDWVDRLNSFFRLEGDARLHDAAAGDLDLASELVGEALMKQSGEEQLGEIAEIVFAPSDGTIRYAAMSFGGFVRFGDKLFAIPWELLSFSRTNEEPSEMAVSFSARISEQQLNEAGGFSKGDWPRHPQGRWAAQIKRTAERGEPSAALE